MSCHAGNGEPRRALNEGFCFVRNDSSGVSMAKVKMRASFNVEIKMDGHSGLFPRLHY